MTLIKFTLDHQKNQKTKTVLLGYFIYMPEWLNLINIYFFLFKKMTIDAKIKFDRLLMFSIHDSSCS